MRLRVTGRYECRGVSYEPGEIDVPDAMAVWLLADAPGAFTVAEAKATATDTALGAPPADRAIKGPRKRA